MGTGRCGWNCDGDTCGTGPRGFDFLGREFKSMEGTTIDVDATTGRVGALELDLDFNGEEGAEDEDFLDISGFDGAASVDEPR